MHRTGTDGSLTLIESRGGFASSLSEDATAALKRASVVFAAVGTHPTVLAIPGPEATIEFHRRDASALPEVTAHAGAHVVYVVPNLDEEAVRASSVPVVRIHRERNVPPPVGPLVDTRILVTRPRDVAEAQRARLEGLGADAVALPCLQLEPPQDIAALDRAVAEAIGGRRYDGVIVSSPRGVRAVHGSFERLNANASTLKGITWVAVGTATARACTAAGLRPDIVPEHPRSEGIVDALARRNLLGGRWLHIRAADGRDTLQEAIEREGGRFELAVGYRATRPVAPPGVLDWTRDGVDFVAVHSGKTGANLIETLGDASLETLLGTTRIVSAGPVTTAALEGLGLQVAATAKSPGDDGMIAALVEAVGQ